MKLKYTLNLLVAASLIGSSAQTFAAGMAVRSATPAKTDSARPSPEAGLVKIETLVKEGKLDQMSAARIKQSIQGRPDTYDRALAIESALRDAMFSKKSNLNAVEINKVVEGAMAKFQGSQTSSKTASVKEGTAAADATQCEVTASIDQSAQFGLTSVARDALAKVANTTASKAADFIEAAVNTAKDYGSAMAELKAVAGKIESAATKAGLNVSHLQAVQAVESNLGAGKLPADAIKGLAKVAEVGMTGALAKIAASTDAKVVALRQNAESCAAGAACDSSKQAEFEEMLTQEAIASIRPFTEKALGKDGSKQFETQCARSVLKPFTTFKRAA